MVLQLVNMRRSSEYQWKKSLNIYTHANSERCARSWHEERFPTLARAIKLTLGAGAPGVAPLATAEPEV